MDCGRVLEVDDLKYKLASLFGWAIPIVFLVIWGPPANLVWAFWVGFGICMIGPLLMVGLLEVRTAFPANQ